MGHKAIDCLERPRKKMAERTGLDIAPDDVVADLQQHGKVSLRGDVPLLLEATK